VPPDEKQKITRRVAIPVAGPIEAFGTLTLRDLRREGTPRRFTDALLNRINQLSSQDYAQRASIIQEWRRSPLYQQYVAIGRAALGEGISVAEYLSRHEQADKMRYQEFEAIAALNQQVRF
jgi:hypothetical protein